MDPKEIIKGREPIRSLPFYFSVDFIQSLRLKTEVHREKKAANPLKTFQLLVLNHIPINEKQIENNQKENKTGKRHDHLRTQINSLQTDAPTFITYTAIEEDNTNRRLYKGEKIIQVYERKLTLLKNAFKKKV